MYQERGTFNAFAEGDLAEYLAKSDQKIRLLIERESEDYILNVNETEYINHLIGECTIDCPSIDFENVSVTSYEKQIPAERFPRNFNVRPGHSYSKQAVVYHLPYTGNAELFRYTPSTRLLWTTEVFLQNQDLCFEVISLREDPEEIKSEANTIIQNLKTQFEYLTGQIKGYNSQLQAKVGEMFRSRKQHFLNKNKMLSSLGVPIKKREGLPKTYAIPTPQTRKSFTTRPVVTEKGYKPDPTLDSTTYHDILQTIHDVGKVFERYPSTYKDKREEDLRDHFLLYLEPRFEGSATGETFNKEGKTDILIRHENSNVFVAECKFWRGQQDYLNSISQLLKYLTWRDSKIALVVFVENKDFSSVIRTVEIATPDHENYLGFIDKREESWFNYRFHIPGDRNREVKLAVLLFHIPS